MKTLILYNSTTGDVMTTISPVDNDNYAVLVTDVSETKQIVSVKEGKVVYADPAEIITKRERLEALLNEAHTIKKELLNYEIGSDEWWIAGIGFTITYTI